MSYGINVTNASGESLFDENTEPYLQTLEVLTISGTPVTYSGETWYGYASSNVTISRIMMIDVPPGGSVLRGAGPYHHVLSWSPAVFRRVVFSYELPAPTGYGAAIYGPSGQLAWSANNESITVEGLATVNQTGPNVSFSTTSDKIALTTRIPLNVPSAGFNLAFLQGVIRNAGGTAYSWRALGTGFGPPYVIGPSPMQFLYGT
jgi:hypothetical protein